MCSGRGPEARIVWLEDISALDYVRETHLACPFRSHPPARGNFSGRIVGYAELSPNVRAVNGFFNRRIFWLKEYDRDTDPHGVYENACPCEAVDPRTVQPNRAAERTERCCWGLPKRLPCDGRG